MCTVIDSFRVMQGNYFISELMSGYYIDHKQFFKESVDNGGLVRGEGFAND